MIIKTNKKVTNPHVCRDCQNRSSICHSICKEYLQFREELDAQNEDIHEQKRMDLLTRPTGMKKRKKSE